MTNVIYFAKSKLLIISYLFWNLKFLILNVQFLILLGLMLLSIQHHIFTKFWDLTFCRISQISAVSSLNSTGYLVPCLCLFSKVCSNVQSWFPTNFAVIYKFQNIKLILSEQWNFYYLLLLTSLLHIFYLNINNQ